MASQLGGSNIPYLEAFELETPVIAMDNPGIKEQVQDAAILVDPNSKENLAAAMWVVLLNEDKRKELITNGKKVLNSWTENDFRRALLEVVNYSQKRLWK